MGIAVPTRKHLWARSKNRCGFPGCVTELSQDSPESDSTGVVMVGEEAHIRSGRPEGPRYDAEYARKGLVDTLENVVLLCPTHHTKIDANNGAGYSVSELVGMKRNHEREIQLEDRLEQIIESYINLSYREDDAVRFEAVDLNGPSVDSLFVDVPLAAPLTTEVSAHLELVAEAHPGDIEARQDARGLAVAGAAQALLHPGWHGNALIQGGPGQGKTTLLQFLCQYYRAHHNGRTASSYTEERHDLAPATTVSRVPFRIDLRHYAAWRRKQQAVSGKGKKRRGNRQDPPASAPTHLEHYLAHRVAEAVGRDFSIEDFARLVSITPTLLALDGLDEVADLADRDAVGEEILAATARLQPNATDLHIFIGSRPGSTSSALWDGSIFPVLVLRPLTTGLRVQYLERWCQQVGVGAERAQDLQTKLLDHQDKAHVRDLGSNPMQLAILLHLLYRKSLLPQQRTDLFDAYIETFLDREEAGKEPLLQDHRELIVHIHRRVAWELHVAVESGESSGSIRRPDLKALIDDIVRESAERQALAKQIFDALTTRMLCLVSRHQGTFEFEVQSLREYFAAMHVFEEAPPQGRKNSRDDCLSALLERPYWSNVARFLVGKLSKGELRALVGNMRSGSGTRDAQLDPYLRSLAVDLVDDRVLRSLPDSDIYEAVEFILDDNGIVFAEDGVLSNGAPLLVTAASARSQTATYAITRLATEVDPTIQRMLVALAARHLSPAELRDPLWEAVLEGPAQTFTTDLIADAAGLADLSPEQALSLRDLLSVGGVVTATESNVRTSLSDTLYRGAYNGNDLQLLNGCATEVGAFATEGVLDHPGNLLVPISDQRTPLAFVLSAGSPTLLADGGDRPRRLLIAPNDGTGPRRRRRTRGGTSDRPLDRIQQYLQAADAVNNEWTNHRRWVELLAAGRDAWDDGLLMRQLLQRVPENVDLTLGSDPDISRGASTRSQLAWWAEARVNASTPAWWALPITSDQAATLTWALGLVTIARTSSVIAEIQTLNSAVRSMSSPTVRALWSATLLAHASSLSTTLRLGEALSRGRISPNGEAAALLHVSAADSARRDLEAHAARDWETLVMQHRLPASAVRALRLEDRGHVASGHGIRAGTTASRTMSATAARQLLANPAGYSPELVRQAAAKLSESRSRAVKPIRETAERDAWFTPTLS